VKERLLKKRNALIISGGALVLMVVIVAVAVGLGHPSVPSDDVAVVDDSSINVPGLVDKGHISKEGFNRLFEQTAKQQGLQSPPAPGDPQYTALRDQALGTALDIAWITGEAQKQGVSVTDTQVQQQLAQTKQQNFKTEADYQKFLQSSGFTQQDVEQRVRLQLISQAIQTKLTSGAPNATDSQVHDYYNANKSQFSQPAKRDIRLILNTDPAQVQKALDALKQDDSEANWKKVAAQYSTDPQSKTNGGLRPAVVAGTFEQPLDDDIFKAQQGQVEGPVTTPTGTYAFEVESITQASTSPFDQVKTQIAQQIKQQQSQESFTGFLSDYRDYWSSLTQCAPDYTIVRCANFTGKPNPCPDPSLSAAQQQQQIQQQGCPPPVQTISPAAPGSIKLFVPNVGGQPQKPHPAGAGTTTPAIPGGGSTIVPGGAGGAPSGGAPSGGAPSGGASAAPPGG
jgi:parvulin-like peptidyl-prolyl isomerase